MSDFKNCLLCNSNNLVVLEDFKKDHLCKCRDCGFVFAQKIPSMQELLDEYAKYPRNDEISPITIRRYPYLLKLFEKYRENNTIIDVGAGDGHFIETAKIAGWEAYATEFDDRAVELCRQKGVHVEQGKLDASKYPSAFFDVIFSSEVLEHINNPVEEIRNFNKILRKGGVVYITTPNLNSLSFRFLKHKWNIFHYPEHLCYYTPKTLEKLFTDNGFRKVMIQTTGFSPSRFRHSLGQSNINNDDERLRVKTENRVFWKFIKKAANAFFNFTKSGDAMKGMFVKI